MNSTTQRGKGAYHFHVASIIQLTADRYLRCLKKRALRYHITTITIPNHAIPDKAIHNSLWMGTLTGGVGSHALLASRPSTPIKQQQQQHQQQQPKPFVARQTCTQHIRRRTAHQTTKAKGTTTESSAEAEW